MNDKPQTLRGRIETMEKDYRMHGTAQPRASEVADVLAYALTLPDSLPTPTSDASLMQDDIVEMLRALGLGDHAGSPHEVVQTVILPALRGLPTGEMKVWKGCVAADQEFADIQVFGGSGELPDPGTPVFICDRDPRPSQPDSHRSAGSIEGEAETGPSQAKEAELMEALKECLPVLEYLERWQWGGKPPAEVGFDEYQALRKTRAILAKYEQEQSLLPRTGDGEGGKGK